MKKEFDKQKVFLSDAGHELKTPVSVISANVDVLLSSYPGNKWLEYIRTETERMAELTKKLLQGELLASDDFSHGERELETMIDTAVYFLKKGE